MQLQNLKASKTILQNHPLTSFQNHFSCFLQKISGSLTPKPLFLPLFPQNPSSLKTQFDNTIQTIGNHAKQALQMGFFPFSPPSHPLFESARTPNFASRTTNSLFPTKKNSLVENGSRKIPILFENGTDITVYALKNSAGHFVWLPDVITGKYLGLFCFEKDEAEVLLEQVKDIEPTMREGLKVDKVALDEVVKLKLDQGQKRCFIPNSSQIMNAIKENVGDLAKDFYGVPVFQSQNLSVMIGKKRYHPVFFKKEDLVHALKASHQQNSFNPALKKGDALSLRSQGKQNHPIFFRYEHLDTPHLGASHQQKGGDNQDCSLEKIIKEMQVYRNKPAIWESIRCKIFWWESPSSKWDEIIFIPLGGTNVSQ